MILDVCLMVHGSWLEVHGLWPRGAGPAQGMGARPKSGAIAKGGLAWPQGPGAHPQVEADLAVSLEPCMILMGYALCRRPLTLFHCPKAYDSWLGNRHCYFWCPNLTLGMRGAFTLASWGTLGRSWDAWGHKKGGTTEGGFLLPQQRITVVFQEFPSSAKVLKFKYLGPGF